MEECCCKKKNTPRDEQMVIDIQKRLNRAIGQVNGVKSMIDENRYCGDVLVQLAAAESALHKVVEQIQQGNTEIIDEAMQLIKKFGGR